MIRCQIIQTAVIGGQEYEPGQVIDLPERKAQELEQKGVVKVNPSIPLYGHRDHLIQGEGTPTDEANAPR